MVALRDSNWRREKIRLGRPGSAKVVGKTENDCVITQWRKCRQELRRRYVVVIETAETEELP